MVVGVGRRGVAQIGSKRDACLVDLEPQGAEVLSCDNDCARLVWQDGLELAEGS